MRGRSTAGFLFSWVGLVLLPFNLVAGGMLAEGLAPGPFAIALALGLLLTFALGVPAVLIAQRSGLNFPQAAATELPRALAGPLIRLAPVVGLGWYALQTAAAAQGLEAVTSSVLPARFTAVPLALAFVSGPLILGFPWLSRTGAVATLAVAVLMAVLAASVGVKAGPVVPPSGMTLVEGALLVLGTWVFSSTTGVMDLARFAGSRAGALCAFAAGLVVADGLLIIVGYLVVSAAGPGLLHQFLSGAHLPGFLFLLLSLWSTNDANAYSVMQVLERLRAPVRPLMLLFAVVAGTAAAVWGTVLEDVLAGWLAAMGWLGIAIGGAWWTVLLSKNLAAAPGGVDPADTRPSNCT